MFGKVSRRIRPKRLAAVKRKPSPHERFPHHRCEVDLSTVAINQRQLFTLPLNPGRGVLVFLLAVNTCSGVSVSDLGAAPLDQPHERQHQLENYVSTFKKHKHKAGVPPVVGCAPRSRWRLLSRGYASFLRSRFRFA